MPNDLTSNPLILDTAAATVLTNDKIRVNGIRWVGATTAGHTATLTDASGKVMWTSKASGANNVEADDIYPNERGQNWDGLVCLTLGSGIIYLEYL